MGRLTPWQGGEAMVTWSGLTFAVSLATLVLAMVAFKLGKKSLPKCYRSWRRSFPTGLLRVRRVNAWAS